MTTNSAQPAPKVQHTVPLHGWLRPYFVRCGTPGCHCTTGPRHGPYWRRYYWEDGRRRKTYIPHAQVAIVKVAIDEQRRKRRERRHEQATWTAAWHDLAVGLREMTCGG